MDQLSLSREAKETQRLLQPRFLRVRPLCSTMGMYTWFKVQTFDPLVSGLDQYHNSELTLSQGTSVSKWILNRYLMQQINSHGQQKKLNSSKNKFENFTPILHTFTGITHVKYVWY